MQDHFNHKELEPKWQSEWKTKKVFEVEVDHKRPKYYILEMFPYPSGTIHMGHVRNYTIGDVVARYKYKRGFNVMHPMGWDAFGLPAENAAIKHKTHPAKWTESNIAYMRAQFERMGWLFDWRREVSTCRPEYYKWEQLFFLKMLEKGLAYRKLSSVNWCNSCNTVLANEQVEEGRCWRCENEVTTKELTQWFFKYTDYAEELLEGCDKLTGWSEQITHQQKNWIGKSVGAEVFFEIADGPLKGKKINIFTTRVDTIFGVSFLSLAPEHPLTIELARGAGREKEVQQFVDKVRKIDKIKRTDASFEKEGVPLGVDVINPVNGKRVPLYSANFVLMDYGTGAVMAVPAHDERDHAFAKKYQIPMVEVILPATPSDKIKPIAQAAFTEYGVLCNSGEFDKITSEQALEKIPAWLEKKSAGKKTINYRLRDWGLSRQRYWGSPIPVIHCLKCGVVPVPEKELPVVLPEDVLFTGEGSSPLTTNEKFLNVACPKCKNPAKRETDTMDTFVESSWYFLRFCSLAPTGDAFLAEDLKYWMPIDQYIGGVEHATMHLLYFRFFLKALQDLGFVPKDIPREPATRLLNQGIVYKDGAKMSKSKGNIVDPDALIEKYGADTTRLFVLFAAPPEKMLEWSDAGVEGSYRFLGRVWRMVHANLSMIEGIEKFSGTQESILNPQTKKLRTKLHQTLKKVTEDLDHEFRFNTAISSIMELVNEIYAINVELSDMQGRQVLREAIETVVRVLNPFAPHLTEELWKLIGFETLLTKELWVDHDPKAVVLDVIPIVVQVNGKHRATLMVSKTVPASELEKMARAEPKVQSFLEGKEVVKVIAVAQKLLNFVVK